MSETQTFQMEDVLSCTTGRLMGDIAGVYRIAEFFTGGPIWTHQIPRMRPLISAEILRQHPGLPTEADADAASVTPENYVQVRDAWIEKHGGSLTLTKPSGDMFALRGPVSELVDMVGKDRVIVVTP